MRVRVCGHAMRVVTNDEARPEPEAVRKINLLDPEGLQDGARVSLSLAHFRYARALHELNERNRKFWETHALGGTE